METVVIESQLIHYDNSNLKAEMRMYNQDKSQLKAILWGTFVHYNFMTKKREMHSEDMMSLFGNVVNPVNAQMFEERVMQVRPKKAK